MITKVIFRKCPTGEIVALFPEVPFDEKGTFCVSYSHIGQHGPADCNCFLKLTNSAKPDEYTSLAAELGKLGYILKPVQRISTKMHQTRISNLPG